MKHEKDYQKFEWFFLVLLIITLIGWFRLFDGVRLDLWTVNTVALWVFILAFSTIVNIMAIITGIHLNLEKKELSKYKKYHKNELQSKNLKSSSMIKLEESKKLLLEGIITEEEYLKRKKIILDNFN